MTRNDIGTAVALAAAIVAATAADFAIERVRGSNFEAAAQSAIQVTGAISGLLPTTLAVMKSNLSGRSKFFGGIAAGVPGFAGMQTSAAIWPGLNLSTFIENAKIVPLLLLGVLSSKSGLVLYVNSLSPEEYKEHRYLPFKDRFSQENYAIFFSTLLEVSLILAAGYIITAAAGVPFELGTEGFAAAIIAASLTFNGLMKLMTSTPPAALRRGSQEMQLLGPQSGLGSDLYHSDVGIDVDPGAADKAFKPQSEFGSDLYRSQVVMGVGPATADGKALKPGGLLPV